MTPPDDVIAAAQAGEAKWKIPASVTIAQWALESAWGKHLPSGSNNPFGIKAVGDQPFVLAKTIEHINGHRELVDAKFRKFDTIADAFDAHNQLLATSPRYANARRFINDPVEFADALTNVYATEPHYGALLNTIIKGANLTQYDTPPVAGAPNLLALAAARVTSPQPADGTIKRLIELGTDPHTLQAIQTEAARKLKIYDGEVYPRDGCAITLSLLLQKAGYDVPDTFQALALCKLLTSRGWQEIPVGQQQGGDIGSTCQSTAHHGYDHIYLVLYVSNSDEMVIADNQQSVPHFRFASGQGKTPTRYFLRAPGNAVAAG